MKREKVLMIVVVLALIFVSNAAYAQEVALSVESKGIAMNDLLNSAITPLAPLLQKNGSLIDVTNREATLTVSNPEDVKARFLNMFINAAAHAPKASKITTGYNADSRTLFIKVSNKNIRFDVDRKIKDMDGNIYNLKTKKGKEAVYSMAI